MSLRFAFSSDSFEWYTPADILERFRFALGGPIHFDPASSSRANEVVRARRYYSLTERGEDALVLPWRGRNTWLNPPYGQRSRKKGDPEPWGGNQRLFYERLMSASWTQAGYLCTAAIGDLWFRPIIHEAPAVCLFDRRVQFVQGPGARNQPTKGNALAFWGEKESLRRFSDAFSDVGRVIRN